jgi:hypothetical protein
MSFFAFGALNRIGTDLAPFFIPALVRSSC